MGGRTPARLLSAALALLGVATFTESLGWVGGRFGGFFVLPNLVVPSIALDGWSGVAEGTPPWQHVLVAVDGQPVRSAADAYARIAAHRPGETVRYDLVHDGARTQPVWPVRTFGAAEHLLIFGAYFLNGLCYLLLAVLAAERWGDGARYRGLAAFGWVGAAYVFTAIDLYGAGRFFRLHALVEALLCAAAAQLALVCVRDRMSRRPGTLLAVWGLPLALAAVYQALLYQPAGYSAVHATAQALGVLPVLALVVELALAETDLPGAVGAAGTRYLFTGAVAGVAVPAAFFAVSSAAGGSAPVNQAAWLGFVFPLCCIAAVPGLLPDRVRPALLRPVLRTG